MKSPVRFSSCRGVSFEIKSHADPFAIKLEDSLGSKAWLRFTKLGPTSVDRSTSISSSHYCDLDLDDDDHEGGYNVDQEKQKQVIPLHNLIAASKHKQQQQQQQQQAQAQQPKTARKKASRLSIILLHQGLFTVYKRLFAVCFALNITGLILATMGRFPYARKRAALFSIANIFALTLCRSEVLLRVVFWLAVKLLGRSFVPLFVKTAATSLLQSLGGIHSGCGVSSIAWLVYVLVLTLRDRQNASPEIIAVASAILGLLCLSSLAAFPLVRHLHHNVFERTHRFAGWIALALLWAFVLLTLSYDPKTKTHNKTNLIAILTKRQEFWFTVAITILIIIPWLTVRRVPVRITAPSGHCSIIKFSGGVKAGILGRISPSPFSEWHAFGIISDGRNEHMMLAGAIGDFTKSLVSNPPSHLWVRGVHFSGLPYLVNMYDRILLVATGSGICVFLSFLLQRSSADVCLVWVAKGIEQNFGKEIKEMVSGHPEGKVIVHDTATSGRPNVAEMSVDAARAWRAEAVIVTSNPEGSRDVVGACRAAGIPAFGPIWDS